MKVLVELRPAFEGHSGIPQETRLLFRGLAGSQFVEVAGLLQSGGLVAAPGLTVRQGVPQEPDGDGTKTDTLSRVVVSLQHGPPSDKLESARRRLLAWFGPPWALLASYAGRPVPLGWFDPTLYRDFLWRSLFDKSLPSSDFDAVVGAGYRVLRWPWSRLHALGVFTGWFGRSAYPRLDTTGIDVVIAETPFPARVLPNSRLVVRYHDAIPLLMPHTIKHRGYHRSAHYQALRCNAAEGAWFACVSDATRRDLLSVMPSLASRSVTIPNLLSDSFFFEHRGPEDVAEIVWRRKNRIAFGGGDGAAGRGGQASAVSTYLLIVGTIEPRKNHLGLIDAWERLRANGFAQLELVVVGSLGWEQGPIVDRLVPWLKRGAVHVLAAVPSDELRLLYRHAAVTVCPSFGEGFDFPGVEAMRCGGVVAASDLAVHRDVFADACVYFDPYSSQDMADVIGALLRPESGARRRELVEAGARVAARHLPECVMPLWEAFLLRVVGERENQTDGIPVSETRMSIDREIVVSSYRVFLKREPESEAIVETSVQGSGSIQAFLRGLADSREFTDKCAMPGIGEAFKITAEAVQVTVTDEELTLLMKRVSAGWNRLGDVDPYWSVLSTDEHRLGRMDEHAKQQMIEGGAVSAALIEHLEMRSGVRLPRGVCLELGCGVGRVTYWLAQKFARVIAVDISPGNLALCRENLASRGIDNVDFVLVTSLSSYDVLPEVDVFLSNIVLQHNPPPIQHAILDKVLGKVKPGGGCIFQTPDTLNGYSFGVAEYLASPDQEIEMHPLPMRFVLELLHRHGLRVANVVMDTWTGMPGSYSYVAVK